MPAQKHAHPDNPAPPAAQGQLPSDQHGGDTGPHREPNPPREEPKPQNGRRRKRYLDEWRRLNDRKRRVYTPWLLVRYSLTDVGLRPMPAGEAHWHSPDIFVESSDPTGKAVAGEPNFVHARIFNLGKAPAVPTRVDFYWADPSIGLGPAHMNLIGTEWVEIYPHTAKDVRCSQAWIPVFVNDGHECLKVNCTNPLFDPITHPFEPRNDRHAGQRNITVLPGSAGQVLPFILAVNNVFAMPVFATITARVEHLAVEKQALANLSPREVINLVAARGAREGNTPAELVHRYSVHARNYGRAQRMAQFLTGMQSGKRAITVHDLITATGAQRSAACLNAVWDECSCLVASGHAGSGGEFLSTLGELAQPASAAAVSEIPIQETQLRAFEQKRLKLELRVPSNARPGEFVVIHLQQRVAGILTGGYTIVIDPAKGVYQRKQ
jgi:hypothetical protein